MTKEDLIEYKKKIASLSDFIITSMRKLCESR